MICCFLFLQRFHDDEHRTSKKLKKWKKNRQEVNLAGLLFSKKQQTHIQTCVSIIMVTVLGLQGAVCCHST